MSEKLVCVQDYEKHAIGILPSAILGYYTEGADQEQTLRDNRDAFRRWRLMPRMLRGVSHRSMSTSTLGCKVSAPFGLAPSAMQRMAHPDGEVAAAKAAAAAGVIYTLSTMSTSSIEEIAAAAPNGSNWFQLYIFKERQVTIELIRRAERANFKALVLTVDTPILGHRLTSERNGFHLPSHLKMGNFEFLDENSIETGQSGFSTWFSSQVDPSLTWKDIDWLKSVTTLPIVLKGILRPDDAELAIKHGCSAVGVSNHGGRQLDGVLSAIDALPEIVAQVNGRCEVFLDGGVTQGTDILKVLALGASMAFIGRPVLWGLSAGGESGVKNVIHLLKKEFDLAMALAGCSTLTDIDGSLVLCEEIKFSKM